MPSEPERPIEKLLRAGARQRRERAGEGWEMHPSTRRLLQGEVARRYPRPDQGKPRRFGWLFGQGWTRPIVASGAVALMVAVVWISVRGLQPSPKPAELLARNEELRPSAAEPAAPASSPAPAPTQTDLAERDNKTLAVAEDKSAEMKKRETVVTDDKQLDQAKDGELVANAAKTQPAGGRQEEALQQAQAAGAAPSGAMPPAEAQTPPMALRYGLSRNAPVPSPAAGPGSSGAPSLPTDALAGRGDTLFSDRTAGAESSKQLVPSLNAAGTNPTVQYGYFAAAKTVNRNGRAVQLSSETESMARRKATVATAQQSSPDNQVLVSFRMESSGNQVRITDRDGSVYAGTIRAINAGFTETSTQPVTASGAINDTLVGTATGLPAASSFVQPPTASFFQVIGTNRTSNQKVIFSGTLTAGVGLGGSLSKGTVAQDHAVSSAVAPSTATNIAVGQGTRISGAAVIGTGPMIQVEAASVPDQTPGP